MNSHLKAKVMSGHEQKQVSIPCELFDKLVQLGIIDPSNVRSDNVGESNYSKHLIQPWAIWMEYGLNPWDADIVKRILRSKGGTPEEQLRNRIMDYQKISHICNERLRQLNAIHLNNSSNGKKLPEE